MARGQSPVLSVVALAASASQGSSSVYAGGAMEAADVAATFAAVKQKLNRDTLQRLISEQHSSR